jgi:hypothetical protein
LQLPARHLVLDGACACIAPVAVFFTSDEAQFGTSVVLEVDDYRII